MSVIYLDIYNPNDYSIEGQIFKRIQSEVKDFTQSERFNLLYCGTYMEKLAVLPYMNIKQLMYPLKDAHPDIREAVLRQIEFSKDIDTISSCANQIIPLLEDENANVREQAFHTIEGCILQIQIERKQGNMSHTEAYKIFSSAFMNYFKTEACHTRCNFQNELLNRNQ